MYAALHDTFPEQNNVFSIVQRQFGALHWYAIIFRELCLSYFNLGAFNYNVDLGVTGGAIEVSELTLL